MSIRIAITLFGLHFFFCREVDAVDAGVSMWEKLDGSGK